MFLCLPLCQQGTSPRQRARESTNRRAVRHPIYSEVHPGGHSSYRVTYSFIVDLTEALRRDSTSAKRIFFITRSLCSSNFCFFHTHPLSTTTHLSCLPLNHQPTLQDHQNRPSIIRTSKWKVCKSSLKFRVSFHAQLLLLSLTVLLECFRTCAVLYVLQYWLD